MDQLLGSIQSYAWGDTSFIAELHGRSPTGEPEAEWWLGAHPVAPSRLATTGGSLAEAVELHPDAMLGAEVSRRFGSFPFLLKILAAARPLSIQAHPSAADAEAGFAREQAAGVPLDSPTRSYRDPNHKPELICALTRFEAKCGFRRPGDTALVVDALNRAAPSPALAGLGRELVADGRPAERLAAILERLLGVTDTERASLVSGVLEGADQLLGPAELPAELAGHRSELAWLAELDRFYPGDVGVVVSLLLNHVTLEPGQAMFLAAGNLHSYLRGAGVELMANSDNVLRGGLTGKHVDVDELLDVVDTHPDAAPVQTAEGACHRFRSAVPEFSLTRLRSGPPATVTPTGPEIVLVTEGRVMLEAVESPGQALTLGRGQSGFVAWSDGPYRLTLDPDSTAWRATVGDLTLS